MLRPNLTPVQRRRGVPFRCLLPLAATALLLSACASIPLSTMWKLRNFGPEQLATIHPGSLRVAVRFEPEWVRMTPDETRLTLRLVPHEGQEQVHEWQMQPAGAAPEGLVPDGETEWQLFRLTEDSARKVEALRPLLDDGERQFAAGEFSLAFGMEEGERIAALEQLRLTVRLALAADQQPFTLFDRYTIPVRRGEDSAP